MKVRVKHFSGDTYCIQYKIFWFMPWFTLYKADVSSAKPFFWTQTSTVLFLDTEKAIAFAKTLNSDSINEWNYTQAKIYKDKVAEYFNTPTKPRVIYQAKVN